MSSSNKQLASKRKKVNALNKKIPKNPRYKHVKSVLDTGESMSRYLEKVEEIRANYRLRPGEIFKRLKCTTFAHMVLQVFTFVEPEDDVAMEGMEVSPVASEPEIEDDPLSSPGRTTFAQVAHGVGERDGAADSSGQQEPLSAIPFLILDVRDRDAYERCHIITARSYPAAMLTRSCNYFTREILQYKNAPGKVIILYDEDERIAADCATTFIQRDVANVFMLSGGLKVLAAQFPEGVLTGVLPDTLKPASSRASSGLRTAAASRTGTAGGRVTGAGRAASTVTPRTPKPSDDLPPSRPLVTPPPRAPDNLVTRPGWFTVDDIQNIEDTLDSLLLDGDRSGSRATASRTGATPSGAGARSTPGSRASTAQRSVPSSSRSSKLAGRPM